MAFRDAIQSWDNMPADSSTFRCTVLRNLDVEIRAFFDF